MIDHKYDIVIIIPCFKRPERTKRIINQVLNQTINGWEAFIIGDGCSEYQKLIDSGFISNAIKVAELNGNKLHAFNLDKNYGGYGYEVLNYAFKNNNSKYITFAGNDDFLSFNHFEHYLSEIENSDLDMVAYPTFVGPYNSIRVPQLNAGKIGHSEIIIKSDLVRDFNNSPEYGHDWGLIDWIINNTPKIKISSNNNYTYIVTHIPGFSIDYID